MMKKAFEELGKAIQGEIDWITDNMAFSDDHSRTWNLFGQVKDRLVELEDNVIGLEIRYRGLEGRVCDLED